MTRRDKTEMGRGLAEAFSVSQHARRDRRFAGNPSQRITEDAAMANGNDLVRTVYVRESNVFREATPEREPLLAAYHAISKRFRRGATLNFP